MSRYGSPAGFFLFDGYSLLANKLQGMRQLISANSEPSTAFGDGWEENLPTGMRRGELAQEGAFFSDDAGSFHERLAGASGSPDSDVNGTPGVACVGFEGNLLGQEFVGYSGAIAVSYEVISTVNSVTRANAEYVISGIVERGEIVVALASTSGDGDSESTPVDGGAGNAPSTDGGSAYLQMTALDLSGRPDLQVTVRDSDDNIVYGDLVAFTAVTAAPAGERVTVAGNVERYVAADWVYGGAAGTPTATFFVGFARN